MGMMRSILLLFIVAVAVAEVTSSGYRIVRPSITICPADPFDVDADVRILKTAIDNSNVTAITDVLTKRARRQRLEIAEKYKTNYRDDLIENLRNVSTGNIKNLTVALMTRLTDYWTEELHDAISRSPIDERAIIEFLFISSENDSRRTTTAYNEKYGSLESDLKGNSSQLSLRRLLASRIAAQLRGYDKVDVELMTSDAQRLHNASVNQWMDTDESPLYSILVNRRNSYLRVALEIYEELSGRNIEDAIEKVSFHDNENKKGLLALVKCIKSPFDFLADSLIAGMPKDKTDERTLTRIIVTRSEFDLNNVKNVFIRSNSSLNNLIAERITSDDDYKYALLSIITPSRRDCSTDVDK